MGAAPEAPAHLKQSGDRVKLPQCSGSPLIPLEGLPPPRAAVEPVRIRLSVFAIDILVLRRVTCSLFGEMKSGSLELSSHPRGLLLADFPNIGVVCTGRSICDSSSRAREPSVTGQSISHDAKGSPPVIVSARVIG